MKLILPGDPIAQIRMKYSGRNGVGRIYDPRERDKRELKAIIGAKHSNRPHFRHPRVSFIFHMPIPKSIPKKLLPLYESGLLKHEKKPDTDNLVKLYLDCMDPIIFDGDQKVTLGPCVKVYHPFPKTIVIVHETSEILSPLEVDPMTWYALFGKESGKCSCAEIDSLPDFYTPDYLDCGQWRDNCYPRQIVESSEPKPLAQWQIVLESQALAQLRQSADS